MWWCMTLASRRRSCRARADAVRLPSGSVEPESGVTVILKLA